MNQLSKYEAIDKTNNLNIINIRYYMNDINATYETCLQWRDKFIKYLNEDYNQTGSSYRECVDVFNKFYWLPNNAIK